MGLKIAGTAKFRVDGIAYALKGSIEHSLTEEESEGSRGMAGDGHIQVTSVNPMIKGTFFDDPDVDPTIFEGLQDATVQLDLRNKTKIVFPECFQVGRITHNDDEGTYELEFQSMGTATREKIS